MIVNKHLIYLMDLDKRALISCAEYGPKHDSLSLSLSKGKKTENTAVDTHFFFISTHV